MKAFRPWWTVDLGTQRPVLGSRAALASCAHYVGRILQQGKRLPPGGAPMIIGESGVPFDLGG